MKKFILVLMILFSSTLWAENEEIVTYEQDILPLFEAKCAQCHNENSNLPNWLDYEVAYQWCIPIYHHVYMHRDMPKAGTMTEEQRELVANWVLQGAPQTLADYDPKSGPCQNHP